MNTIEKTPDAKLINLGQHLSLATFLKDECIRHAQLSLNDYVGKALREEDGKVEFTSCFDFEGLRIFYKCDVQVPLIQEYCNDVDDYLYVESEDVTVDNLEIEIIEPVTSISPKIKVPSGF